MKDKSLKRESNTALLSAETMPERDADGLVYHPDLENLLVDGDEGDELPLDMEKIKAAGYRAAFVGLDSQHAEGEPEFDEYWSKDLESCAVSKWKPKPPDDSWRLVAIYDTEWGPYAMFVQQLTAED